MHPVKCALLFGVGNPPDFVQFGRPVFLPQGAEDAAALDARQLLIVANQNELGPALPRLGRHLGQVLGGKHGGLVDDQHRARVPLARTHFEPLEFARDGRGVGKAVALHVLHNGIGPGEALDTETSLLVRLANCFNRGALAGAGFARDHRQPLGANGMSEGVTLLMIEVAETVEDVVPYSVGHPMRRALMHLGGVLHDLALGRQYCARSVAGDRCIGGFAQADNLLTREDLVRQLAPLGAADNRAPEQPFEVASRERRAVGRNGFQNLLRIAGIDRLTPLAADNSRLALILQRPAVDLDPVIGVAEGASGLGINPRCNDMQMGMIGVVMRHE